MSAEILAEGIGKRFGKFEALKSISVKCRAGTFTAILGPSGCGKTTLLRLMAGLGFPSSGRILFDGAVVSSPEKSLPPEKRNVGMVFQSFALWPHMTVLEHVLFALKHHEGGQRALGGKEIGRKQDIRKDAIRILESVGLESLHMRHPAELSGGQRQRVALARAIAGNPGVLLMDEPLSSLDADLRVEMRHEILRVHKGHGSTVLYVTHDQDEAMAMADRIIVMNEGGVEQTGSPEEIYTKPSSVFVARFVSKANLIPGSWDGGRFYPEEAQGGTEWDGKPVASFWRENGMYPVRPEQFSLTSAADPKGSRGIPAVVESVQYLGRELHYSLRGQRDLWRAYLPVEIKFSPGERVWLDLTPKLGALGKTG
ncbi:MAG: ABC transporter ATP-binding protein [Synergistaceae bacterium]|jgi:iron(III) transport system ATP-binding protein|nr:ABC transporter ATP-binding protein [Synergistaceae bacterium]